MAHTEADWLAGSGVTCHQYWRSVTVSPPSPPIRNCPQPGHCGPIRGQESQSGGGWKKGREERGQQGEVTHWHSGSHSSLDRLGTTSQNFFCKI